MLPLDVADRLRTQIDALPGWCRPDKAVRLADFVLTTGARLSVELGVFGGRGTLALATGHHTLGTGYVVGIDPWATAPCLAGSNAPENDAWWAAQDLEAIYQRACAGLLAASLLPHWQLHRCTSQEAAPLFGDRTIDVLHEDSNHSAEVSQEEVRLWMPKMRPGSLWIMDDIGWASLQETQRRLVADHGATLREQHEDWAVYQLP